MPPSHSTDKEAQITVLGLPVRWENPSNRRYYAAVVQQNLFGEWEMFCYWGGIGTRRGGSRAMPALSREDALHKLAKLSTRRSRRHYEQVCP